MKRNATAVWQGSGKEGKGNLTTESGVLENTPYSFKMRFEEGVTGTNPEELVAAAHAGCFTMKLSFNLNEAGFVADKLETKCAIKFENGAVVGSHLILKASVKDVSNEKFAELVKSAEENCPMSKLLDTKITSEWVLNA